MRRLILAGLLLTSGCSLTPTGASGVASIQVTNNASSNGVFVGDTVQLNAEPLDFQGNPLPIAVRYTSSNTSVATVDNFGKIVAVGAGTTNIGISAGGQTAVLALDVDGNVTATIVVMPQAPTVTHGTQLMLTAVVRTTLNNPARGKTVTWSTADATRVSVDQTGTVTGITPSTGVAVCATATDKAAVKGCASVTVQ